MKEEYIYYRKKAGLDFDRYIKLHPEIDGEKVFQRFVKNYDNYIEQRNMILDKYEGKFDENLGTQQDKCIFAERWFSLVQIEETFRDVVLIILGLDPECHTIKFGSSLSSRYFDAIKDFLCPEMPGFFKGADGLYRMAYFYEGDTIPPGVLRQYYELGDKAYRANTRKNPAVNIFIEGLEIKLPKMDGYHLKLLDKLVEIEGDIPPPPVPPPRPIGTNKTKEEVKVKEEKVEKEDQKLVN